MEDGPGFCENSTRRGGKAHTAFWRRVMPRTDKVTGMVSGAAPPTFSTPGTGLAAISREIVSKGAVRVRLSTSSLANNGLGPSAARTGFAQDRMENVAAAKAIFRTKHITALPDRKSTRLNSSHGYISYAVFCLKKKKFMFISWFGLT